MPLNSFVVFRNRDVIHMQTHQPPWKLLGQGVEIYYNLALTPWLHVTADMQTIDPATAENNTALMGSLRIGITL